MFVSAQGQCVTIEATLMATVKISGNQALPDPCEVRQGEELVFEGGEKFELEFDRKAPKKGGGLKHKSKKKPDKQEVRMDADNDAGEYVYTIRVGDKVVDPAIIIRSK